MYTTDYIQFYRSFVLKESAAAEQYSRRWYVALVGILRPAVALAVHVVNIEPSDDSPGFACLKHIKVIFMHVYRDGYRIYYQNDLY